MLRHGVFVVPTDKEKKLSKNIYLLKKRDGPEGQKKRQIDVLDPSFGQFTKLGLEVGGVYFRSCRSFNFFRATSV